VRPDKMKFWTGDVRLIRVVVRREAPANTRIVIRRPVSRARSIRETFELGGGPSGPSARTNC